METLADRIAREGPINELDAVGWAIRLAKRIESMHALGVVHGNLSPACLQMEGSERAARAQLVDLRRSSTSLACQSPERVSGGDLSQADDTWALACTLYASLTGAPAFTGADEVELRHKIATSSPAPLAVFDVGDDDLQRILDDAFARDMERRTTSVAALRAALEEWHPDPNVGALPAIEEEDTESGGLAGDDDDERTILRSPLSAVSGRLSSPFGPPAAVPLPRASSPGAAPPPRASSPGLRVFGATAPGQASTSLHGGDDDDEDVRTVMRTVPDRFVGSASRSGAFAAMPPGSSGAFRALGAHPALGAGDDDEATRMLPAPSFADQDEDDDDQKTLMRSSEVPDAPSVPGESSPGRSAARPLPAAGGPYPSAGTPSASGAAPLFAPGAVPGLDPAPPGAAPPALLPPPVVMGAAPIAPAAPVLPAPAPRRTVLWITLAAFLLAAAAGAMFVLR